MGSSEKLCLKWNDFQENAGSAFRALRGDKDFPDVTLACEDGQQISAHKLILATSSPLFKDLLTRNQHPRPLIYMRGTRSEDLIAMVDFLYLGEANVYQENLDTFLALAEELRLKGLTKDADSCSPAPEPSSQPAHLQKKLQSRESEDQINKDEQTEVSQIAVPSDLKVNVEAHELDEQIRSMMSKSKTQLPGQSARTCNMCGKEGSWTNIWNHIETNHVTGISHNCNICGKTSRSRNGLSKHKGEYHKDLIFSGQRLLSDTIKEVVTQ